MPSKAEGHDVMWEDGLRAVGGGGGEAAAAVALTLQEKEAVINIRAEEKRSAVRREALGWDRCCYINVA